MAGSGPPSKMVLSPLSHKRRCAAWRGAQRSSTLEPTEQNAHARATDVKADETLDMQNDGDHCQRRANRDRTASDGPLLHAQRSPVVTDLLAGISFVTIVAHCEYLAGSLVVLMVFRREALESNAVRSASSVLRALARRMPSVGHPCALWRAKKQVGHS